MKIENSKKSNSFRAPLLELVIIIGLFAIVSVYLLKMFMASDKLRGKAVITTKSVLETQSVVEYIKGIDKNTASDIYSAVIGKFGGRIAGDHVEIFYNKSFEVVSDNAEYVLIVSLKDEESLVTGNVGVYSSGKEEKVDYCILSVAKEKSE